MRQKTNDYWGLEMKRERIILHAQLFGLYLNCSCIYKSQKSYRWSLQCTPPTAPISQMWLAQLFVVQSKKKKKLAQQTSLYTCLNNHIKEWYAYKEQKTV